MDKCKCLKENWIGWTTVKCCNLCGNPIEKFWDNQQTPITPESLEGTGFENAGLNVISKTIKIKEGLITVFCSKQNNQMWFSSNGLCPDLFFDNVEQFQEWLKPFTKGEGNG